MLNMVYNLTIDNALKMHGDNAKKAIEKELDNMQNKKVWDVVNLNDLDYEKRKGILPSKMFLREKANGTLKA